MWISFGFYCGVFYLVLFIFKCFLVDMMVELGGIGFSWKGWVEGVGILDNVFG